MARNSSRGFAVVAVALTLGFSACSSTSSSSPATQPSADTTTTGAPSTTAAATTTTVASTSVALALPNGPMEAGATYRVARSSLGRSVQLTNANAPAFSFNGRGGFVVTSDDLGTELLVEAFDLATATVFDDPLVDGSTFLRGTAGGLFPEILDELTSPAPTDVFAYLAALPGMELSTPVEVEFAGYPAMMATWKVGAFDGGYPCFQSDRGSCLLAFSIPAGWLSSYWTGDSGTTYVVDVDGQSVLVEVQDRPGAKEIADSLVIGE